MSNSASWVLSSLVFATAFIILPARADDLSDCTQPSDMPRVIAGCSKLLNTSTTLSSLAAIAFRNRSAAYAAMGDFQRAEEDYREAIALDPAYRRSARSDEDASDQPLASVELRLSDPASRRPDLNLPVRDQ